jgi:hypothetical protein
MIERIAVEGVEASERDVSNYYFPQLNYLSSLYMQKSTSYLARQTLNTESPP